MAGKLRQLCCAILLHPAEASAQYTLHGVVRDSLAGSVLAGASVRLVPAKAQWETGSSAIADSGGQYRITGIPGGRYLVGFVHPRLDSLGFDAVVLTIDVSGNDSEIVRDLALPAAPTLVRSICGGLPANSGLLFGKVLRSDAGRPVSAGRIVAEWRELSLDKQPREWRTQSVVAQPADDGRFTLCGVPTDVAFRAHAEALGLTGDLTKQQNSPIAVSGTIDVEFTAGEPALHRDFIVSPVLAGASRAAGTASVVGRVLDDVGRPVDRARVVLRASAAADSVAITDSTGRFRLESLHGGTYSIEIDRIGMEPRRSAVDLLDGTSRRADFSLRRVAQELAGVTVTARSSMEQAGFDYRRTHRKGFFRTESDLAREGAVATSFALLSAPMLMQWGSNASGRPALAGPLRCKPLLFIDGARAPMPSPSDAHSSVPPRAPEPGRGGTIDPRSEVPPDLDDILPIYRIGGVEVYAPGEAPGRFADPFGRCSSIVIWSKGVVNTR